MTSLSVFALSTDFARATALLRGTNSSTNIKYGFPPQVKVS